MNQLFNKNLDIQSATTKDFIVTIVLSALILFILKSYFVSSFRVYGSSMCDTLNSLDGQCEQKQGEFLLVNKLFYQNIFGRQIQQPQRGDIIIFHPPQDDREFFVKRIIGLPNETVLLKEGEIYIYSKENPEGIKLNEPYLNQVNSHKTYPSEQNNNSFKVPEGQYFALGDNRLSSADSRSCFDQHIRPKNCEEIGLTPYVKSDRIEGKAWIVFWPFEKMRVLSSLQY